MPSKRMHDSGYIKAFADKTNQIAELKSRINALEAELKMLLQLLNKQLDDRQYEQEQFFSNEGE